MSAETVTKRKVGLGTLISSIFLIATVVWGAYSLILVEGGYVRAETPHEKYDRVEPWPYNIDWAGGHRFWFDNLNYSGLNMNDPLPPDLLNNDTFDTTLFVVSPVDPPQLWRSSAFDDYDGHTWSKSMNSSSPVTPITRSDAEALGNTIYTVYLNITAGPNVGSIELPILFPEIQIVDGSLHAYPEERLLEYSLQTDDYNTLLFNPLVEGETGSSLLVSFDVTYTVQDLAYIAQNALTKDRVPPSVRDTYATLNIELSDNVLNEISQFDSVGSNVYETAMAVQAYFAMNYELKLEQYQERPGPDEEVTDWFIQRGGGLPMDFATAYCVFMRALGIPARVVYGFAVGDRVNDEHRAIKVKHMMFWAEVYVPLVGGGQWVQVLPLPVPEVPENTAHGNLVLHVFPDIDPPWTMIGTGFNLNAVLLADSVPTGIGAAITFADETDEVPIGTAIIQDFGGTPMARIEYTFPEGATAGPHNISATYYSSTGVVRGSTLVYAVAQPEPLNDRVPPPARDGPGATADGFVVSDTIDVNIKLALDNYTAYWEDTIHVHGVLTYGGNPVDGTTLNNDQMEIYWDGEWWGNATIQADGSYALDIYADPADVSRMRLGQHEIYSYYAGEVDPVTGFPIYLPATSDTSVVTLHGRTRFNLQVSPNPAGRRATLRYEGRLELLNGTPLPGRTVSAWFNFSTVDTVVTNSTGGFTAEYVVPDDHPPGTFPANMSWSSNVPLVDSSSSETVWVDIIAISTVLTINSTPKDPSVVHIHENITIFGYLRANNGTGLPGLPVSIWWHGSIIANVTTGADGYYEYEYQVPAGYEGIVNYFTSFDQPGSGYEPSTSDTLQIRVQKWRAEVHITVTSGPLRLLQNVTIQGYVLLPEGPLLLGNARVTIWWASSSGTQNLTAAVTDSATGIFTYNYTVPIDHPFGTVTITGEFVSPSVEIVSNTSLPEYRVVTNYATVLSGQSNATAYYLNETVYISGRLTFEHNGSGIGGQTLSLRWDNGTVQTFDVTTNATGYFEFTYPLLLTDGPAALHVTINFTAPSRLFNGSVTTLDITLRLYDTSFATALNSTEYHLDEVLEFSGTLRFTESMKPIAGATVSVFYKNATGTYQFVKVTDSSGSFVFHYNFSLSDALGAIYLWAWYNSTDPLWDDALSANETATLILYRFTLTLSTNATRYHLNETAHVWGRLVFEHNGTALSGQQIRIWWGNGTVPTPVFEWYVTDASGYFQFYYNFTTADAVTDITVQAEFINANPLWDNATSTPKTINTQLYQFVLTLFLNDTYYYLNETALVWGRLTYQANGAPVSGQQIRIWWDNGTVPTPVFEWYVTNASGYFQFYYNFTTADAVTDITVQAEFINANPLWDNATSSPAVVDTRLYAFVLTVFANETAYYLNQTVYIWGRLTYQENGAPVTNQQVRIWWDNGTVPTPVFEWYVTNASGYFHFYYPLSTNDAVGTVVVTAEFINTNPLWDNATSSGLSIDLQLYQLNLTISIPANAFLAEGVTMQGTLTYAGGSPPFAGATVNIYLLQGTTWVTVGSCITNSSGHFSFTYNFTVPPDGPGVYRFKFNTTTGPLYNDTESGPYDVDVTRYTVVVDLVLSSTSPHLNETIVFTVHAYFSHNGSALQGAEILLVWYNDTEHVVQHLVTNSTGHAVWTASGFHDHTFLTGILVWAHYAGNDIIDAANSTSQSVSLRRWVTAVQSFSTGGVSDVHAFDIVQITGQLVYDLGGGSTVPFVGAQVEVLLNGTVVAVVNTLGDGSFAVDWLVPADTVAGYYELTARFVSTVNWIENCSSPSLGLRVVQYDLDVDIEVTPGHVYLTSQLNITTVLTLSNGTPYANAPVALYWNHLNDDGGPQLIAVVMTDQYGKLTYLFQVPESVPLGATSVWANCTPPVTYISSSQSAVIDIQVLQMSVCLSIESQQYSVGVGDTLTITGTILMCNGTPLSGYPVEFWWTNTSRVLIGTVTSGPDGSFTFEFDIPWRHQVGPVACNTVFVSTRAALATNSSNTLALTITHAVWVELDDQTVFELTPGDILTVSGVVMDAFGPIPDFTIDVMANGSVVAQSSSFSGDGSFSVSFTVSPSVPLGRYIIVVAVSNEYFVTTHSDTWMVLVTLPTSLSVTVSSPSALMPGESFTVSVSLRDARDDPVGQATVILYLTNNDTEIVLGTFETDDEGTVFTTSVVPSSFTADGIFWVRAEFQGVDFRRDSEDISPTPVHVFTDVRVTNLTPSVVQVNSTFQIRFNLTDVNGIPIERRPVEIHLDNTTFQTITSRDGLVEFTVQAPGHEGVMHYYVVVPSSVAEDLQSEEFTISVSAGVTSGLVMVYVSITAIVIEAVVAIVLVIRHRRSHVHYVTVSSKGTRTATLSGTL